MIVEIICGLSNLYPEEAMDEIKSSYQNGLVDETMINLEDVKYHLNMGKEAALEYLKEEHHNQFIGHIEDEIEWWYCFHEMESSYNSIQASNKEQITISHLENNTTVIKPKKIGRNDPYPCGSNRKYKYCCGK